MFSNADIWHSLTYKGLHGGLTLSISVLKDVFKKPQIKLVCWEMLSKNNLTQSRKSI